MPPRRVFAYGTLELPELVLAITGRRFESEPAVLDGFARSRVRGAEYPGIAPAPDARTDGTLYHEVDDASLAALDRFEGDLYERCEVAVATAAAERCLAIAWVVRPERRSVLGGGPWDRERFRARFGSDTVARMEINGLAHIFVTCGDFARSRAFYSQLLPFLGMRPVLDADGFFYCVGGRTAFGLRHAAPGHAGERFDQGRVGLHHV